MQVSRQDVLIFPHIIEALRAAGDFLPGQPVIGAQLPLLTDAPIKLTYGLRLVIPRIAMAEPEVPLPHREKRSGGVRLRTRLITSRLGGLDIRRLLGLGLPTPAPHDDQIGIPGR